VKSTNYEDFIHVIFSVLLLLPLSFYTRYCSNHFVLKHRQSRFNTLSTEVYYLAISWKQSLPYPGMAVL